jgi:hypothetical protein
MIHRSGQDACSGWFTIIFSEKVAKTSIEENPTPNTVPMRELQVMPSMDRKIRSLCPASCPPDRRYYSQVGGI